MKKLLFFVFTVLVSIALNSQETDPSSFLTQLIPNNPDVASLGKFGDIPVNQYNGTANISVPIHTINFEGLNIPISINYNTSGVRVDQEASLVGLGWNLNAGYNITREIQGFDDLSSSETANNSIGWIYNDIKIELNTSYTYDNKPFVILPEKFADLAQSYNNRYPCDVEPDLFYIQLPNALIKFYLPKIQNNETELIADVINEKNYKVVYKISEKTFEVYDNSGFKYIFDVLERSTDLVVS